MTLAPGATAGRRTRGEGSGARQKALPVNDLWAEDGTLEKSDGSGYEDKRPKVGRDPESADEKENVDADTDDAEEDEVMDDDDDSDYRG